MFLMKFPRLHTSYEHVRQNRNDFCLFNDAVSAAEVIEHRHVMFLKGLSKAKEIVS
jgi:acetoin utilization deacetylase AcuC-like enzyme